eukprot:734372_1
MKLFFVTNRDSIAKTLGKRLAQKKMAKDLTTWLQACRSRGGEDDISFEGLEAITAHIDPTDFIAFNNYERNLRIFSNFCMNTDTDSNPWVVVNTGDRYAARKSLMQSFRSHLHEFESRGKGRYPCCKPKHLVPTQSPGMTMNDMMKVKFSRSWRHSVLAWLTFMSLLLLLFIYSENTTWDDSWYRGPTIYNITALLEEDTDDSIVVGPGKPSDAVDTASLDTAAKKGKTSNKKPDLVDNENDKEYVADNHGAAPEEAGVKRAAKAPKVQNEVKEEQKEMMESGESNNLDDVAI